MIHSLYILLSISKTSLSKLPIHQQHLRPLSPRDKKKGRTHSHLAWREWQVLRTGKVGKVRSPWHEVEMGARGRVWLLGGGTDTPRAQTNRAKEERSSMLEKRQVLGGCCPLRRLSWMLPV